MKKIALMLICIAGALFANTQIKSLDIFTNKTFVTQEISATSNSVDLLSKVALEDIKFILNEDCKTNNIELKYINFENDNLTLKIEKLKEEINQKQNQIKALNSNLSFLEKTSITSISSANDLKNTSLFIKQEILQNHNKIYKINKDFDKLNQDLSLLLYKRANSTFSRLNYDISCSKTKNLMISYSFYNMSKDGSYEINYNSKQKELDIKNSSFIMQSSGVNFKNIDINLYTYNFIQQLKPNKFYPRYLGLYPKKYSKISKSISESDDIVMEADIAMDAEESKGLIRGKPSFQYMEGTTKSFFKASNIDLISGKKTEVLFAKDTYKATHSLDIDGYSRAEAFYKVNFESKKLYGVLNSKLYLDGVYIGKSYQNEIKKDKQSSIFFGTNGFVDVKKELIKDMKEEPFFSINKLKSQKLWRYTIINNNTKAQTLTLLERVPVSKHEDIKVKLIGKTKYTKLDEKGKISFDFELKPKEEKIIEFGYEVETPNKKIFNSLLK